MYVCWCMHKALASTRTLIHFMCCRLYSTASNVYAVESSFNVYLNIATIITRSKARAPTKRMTTTENFRCKQIWKRTDLICLAEKQLEKLLRIFDSRYDHLLQNSIYVGGHTKWSIPPKSNWERGSFSRWHAIAIDCKQFHRNFEHIKAIKERKRLYDKINICAKICQWMNEIDKKLSKTFVFIQNVKRKTQANLKLNENHKQFNWMPDKENKLNCSVLLTASLLIFFIDHFF